MLTVLSVAFPLAPVGPDAVGGAEQILSAIDQALVRAGHRSLVIANEGSRVAGELLALPPPPSRAIDESVRAEYQAATRDLIRRNMGRADLIHLHGIDFARYLPADGPPALITLHMPPGWYPSLGTGRANTWMNCVSRTQQLACPPGLNLVPPIPNGVPVEAFEVDERLIRRHAVTLGRICPEKGQHFALRAAHAADVPLLVAGEVFPYPEHRDYFSREIEPLLDGSRRYLGPVGFSRKRRLLAAARCLLVPSLAPETSSLVAMEAMACGTPVIAYPSGALSEIVAHGRTGFLVNSVDQMAEAIARADMIDPAACHAEALARFSADRMTDAYIGLFRRLLTLATDASSAPDDLASSGRILQEANVP